VNRIWKVVPYSRDLVRRRRGWYTDEVVGDQVTDRWMRDDDVALITGTNERRRIQVSGAASGHGSRPDVRQRRTLFAAGLEGTFSLLLTILLSHSLVEFVVNSTLLFHIWSVSN